MPTPAASRGWRKGIRSLLQTIAGGGLTALVAAIAGGLDPTIAGLLIAGFGALVAYLQNYLETSGKIPVILPTPGLITDKTADAVTTHVVGTVDTVTDVAGGVGTVTGAVLNNAGSVVGSVTSQVGGVVSDVGGIVGGVVGTVTPGGDHEETGSDTGAFSGPGDSTSTDE